MKLLAAAGASAPVAGEKPLVVTTAAPEASIPDATPPAAALTDTFCDVEPAALPPVDVLAGGGCCGSDVDVSAGSWTALSATPAVADPFNAVDCCAGGGVEVVPESESVLAEVPDNKNRSSSNSTWTITQCHTLSFVSVCDATFRSSRRTRRTSGVFPAEKHR